MELEQMSLNQLCELARKQEQALTDSNLALQEQTELAERCRKQAETLEAELLVARAACDAQGDLTQKYQAFALASAQSPTIKQLATQLERNEKWTIAEQQAFAPFLAQFPNESSQGILSLGSAWKHGIAYAQSLAAAPQQHAQAALSDDEIRRLAMSFSVNSGDRIAFARAILSASQQPAAAPSAPPSPLHTDAINALLEVATAAYDALDNSEERANASGGEDAEYIIQGSDFEALSTAMDKIDALPDDEPGITSSGGRRAAWALRGLFSTKPNAAAPAIQQEGAALSDERIAEVIGEIKPAAYASLRDLHVAMVRAAIAAALPSQPAPEAAQAQPILTKREIIELEQRRRIDARMAGRSGAPSADFDLPMASN